MRHRVLLQVLAIALAASTANAQGVDEAPATAAPTLGGPSDPSNFRTEEEVRAEMDRRYYQAKFDYYNAHAYDDLNSFKPPWDPASFYSVFLDSYGLGPGPIGRQSHNGSVTQNGQRLKTIALPGLNVFYEFAARGVGQAMKSVGDPHDAYFQDLAGSGWQFDGGIPYIRMTYILANERDFGPNCSLGGACTLRSDCTYARRGALYMGGEIWEFQQEGIEQSCLQNIVVQGGNNAPPPGCGGGESGCSATLGPIRLRSSRGGMIFDLTGSTPILYMPDGTKWIMNGSPFSAWNNPNIYPYRGFDPDSVTDYGPTESVSANGEITTYQWLQGPAGGTLFVITDARGRTKTWDPGCNFKGPFGVSCATTGPFASTWTVPGPNGAPETYTFNFTYTQYDPRTAFPELVNDPLLSLGANNFCIDQFNSTFDQCATKSVLTLQSIAFPDGRSYQFGYGPWVNLTSITEPHGQVTQFAYGDKSNNFATGDGYTQTFVSPIFNTADNPCPPNLYWQSLLQSRVPVTSTIFPNGLSGSSYSSKQNSFVDANGVFWTRIVHPDGSVEKIGKNHAAEQNALPLEVIADETWTADEKTLVAATYHGSTSTGLPYMVAEQAGGVGQLAALNLNPRNTKTITVKDGVTTTQLSSYDSTSIAAKATVSWDPDVPGVTQGATWSNENVTTSTLKDGSNNVLMSTSSGYQTAASYVNQGLSHLVTSVVVKDATGVPVSRKEFAYDQFPLGGSGQAGLDGTYTSSARGNLTTTTTYLDPVKPAGAVSSSSYYFDNGAVQKTQNPNDFGAGIFTTNVSAFNFGPCASNQAVTTTVQNALSQSSSTVRDCYTSQLLSTLEPDGQRTCNQLDWLGRNVETAAYGDQLTALPTGLSCNACTVSSATACGTTCNTCSFCDFFPACNNTDPRCGACGTFVTRQDCGGCGATMKSCTITDCSRCGQSAGGYVRDGACSTTSGTTVGNGGNGPSTWTEYFDFGVAGVSYDHERTIVHNKDGSPSGRYSKTFTDGMGRPTEICSNIDANLSAGAGTNNETCTFTTYDNMGRIDRVYSPFYATSIGSASPPASGQYSQSTYDEIGRVKQSLFVWSSGSFTTSTSYGAAGNSWVATTTNANGNQSRSVTDPLGHVVELDQYLCAQSPCTSQSGTKLATIMTYDVLGRLLSSTDPLGNVLALGYDGLGRKTSMKDPDLGNWTYGYDDNGNLTSQVDAKKQTISMQYDVLNRITLKDVPPAGPDMWDVTYDYDGVRRRDCYSCFEPSTGKTGFCNTETATCVLVAGEVGKVCTPGNTQGCRNAVCDESCGNPSGCSGATQTCNVGGTAWGTCTGGTCAAPPPQTCQPGATQGCQNPTCDESCGDPKGCAGATQTCTAGGTWGNCTGGTCAPPPSSCTPGTIQGCQDPTCDESCGTPGGCTGATQTCGANGAWGNCAGGTCPCRSGSTRTIACGFCGLETDTCNSGGQWVAGPCQGQGACLPNTSRTLGCGNCGQEVDVCSASCQWQAGTCNNQGVCAAGTSQACGNCGAQTCSSTCQWSTCNGQGVCSPNSTRSSACSDGLGDPGTETDSCSNSCQWNAGVCVVCTPGTVQACDPNDVCANCTGTCAPGRQTCAANGTWGPCSGARCSGGCPPPPMLCN